MSSDGLYPPATACHYANGAREALNAEGYRKPHLLGMAVIIR